MHYGIIVNRRKFPPRPVCTQTTQLEEVRTLTLKQRTEPWGSLGLIATNSVASHVCIVSFPRSANSVFFLHESRCRMRMPLRSPRGLQRSALRSRPRSSGIKGRRLNPNMTCVTRDMVHYCWRRARSLSIFTLGSQGSCSVSCDAVGKQCSESCVISHFGFFI